MSVIVLTTPILAAPVRKPAQIIYLEQVRRIDKSERLRREVLAARLGAAASKAKNPAFRALWDAKARSCAYLPSSELRAAQSVKKLHDLVEVDPRDRPLTVLTALAHLFGLTGGRVI